MNENKIIANFYDIQNNYWTVNGANNTGSVKCRKHTFEKVDPIPGKPKQCFCDEESSMFTETDVQWVKEYWRGVLIER